jgi:hypothetical protein
LRSQYEGAKIGASDKEMAPQEWRLPGTRPTEREETVDTTSIREKTPQVLAGEAPTRECFACYEGVVYIGYLVPTPDGDEEEVYERHRCGLCGGTGRIAADAEDL